MTPSLSGALPHSERGLFSSPPPSEMQTAVFSSQAQKTLLLSKRQARCGRQRSVSHSPRPPSARGRSGHPPGTHPAPETSDASPPHCTPALLLLGQLAPGGAGLRNETISVAGRKDGSRRCPTSPLIWLLMEHPPPTPETFARPGHPGPSPPTPLAREKQAHGQASFAGREGPPFLHTAEQPNWPRSPRQGRLSQGHCRSRPPWRGGLSQGPPHAGLGRWNATRPTTLPAKRRVTRGAGSGRPCLCRSVF